MLNSGYTGKIEDLFCSALKTGGNEEEEVIQYEDEYSSSTESDYSAESRSPSPPPRRASPDLSHHRKQSILPGRTHRSPSVDHSRRMASTSGVRRTTSDETTHRPKSATWRTPPHATRRLPPTLMGTGVSNRPSSAMPSRHNLYKESVAPYWELCAVIPGRLSLMIHRSGAHTTTQQSRDSQRHFFSSDVQDRAHMTVTDVVEFSELIHKKMSDPRLSKKHMIYYTGPNEDARTNAAFLMASYLVMKCGQTAAEAAKCFEKSRGYRLGKICMNDKAPQGYDLDLMGCLFALQRGLSLGWFHLVTSMVEDRAMLAKSLNMQQLIPNVYVFTSPVSGELMHSFYEDNFTGGGRLYGPDKYVETLYEKNITTVVHLDAATYDTNVFTDHGVRVVDMSDAKFEEDKVPPDHLMRRFLRLMSQQPHGSSVGVHSKRAMGRAGTILAIYLMEEYLLTAAEAIGWLRLVRPGMVIGQQQDWIHSKDDPSERAWKLQKEINAPKHGSEKRTVSPSHSSMMGVARTPSLEQRAVRAAAEAVSPHARQLSANPRMRGVVDKMLSVSNAWGHFKASASIEPTKGRGARSPATLASLFGSHSSQAGSSRASSGKSRKSPEPRKHVHTIQIGSGDNVQTIQWTEIESDSDQEN